jgi:hypothetical protein
MVKQPATLIPSQAPTAPLIGDVLERNPKMKFLLSILEIITFGFVYL